MNFQISFLKNTCSLLALASLLLAGCSHGLDTPKADPTPPTSAPREALKHTMDELFLQMIQLRRYMVSDATFSDPANKREIQSHLEKLTELGQAAKHSSLLKARGLQISREVLVSHLKETTPIF